jgi:hypothetical protein
MPSQEGWARQELETRAVHGLASEWEDAVAYLEPEPSRRMRPPLFAVRDLACWGRWARATREIAVSRRLVWEYPWTSVREVLLHETAHQMADEVFGGDATPHGERFRAACGLLHADPRASGDHPALRERMQAAEAGEDDRILLRVRKLLAMAGSGNPHEAEAAMARARVHAAKYNLRLGERERQRGYCSLCLGEPALRHPAQDFALANLLGEFYFVQPIWVAAFVLAAEKMGRVLEVSGTAPNVKMAGYVHDCLRTTVGEQWNAFCAGQRRSAFQRNDFAVGLIAGFRERLAAQDARWERKSGARALVTTRDRGLAVYMKQRYPRLRRSGSRGRMADAEAHDAGREAGRSTALARPIEAGHGIRGLLPEA